MPDKYDILQPLSREGLLYLVRNPKNGEILTARQIEESQYEVYERLLQAYQQGRRLSHQPAVKEICPFPAEQGEATGNPQQLQSEQRQQTAGNPENRRPEQTGNTAGRYLVYEEYVPGENLQSILDTRGVLTSEKARQYMEQLCDALTDLHALGIIHRDVKPENILIGPNDTLCLIDYDIARTIKEEAPRDTRLLGTQGYAAPEQFGFQQTDARTDLYGAGVLYNMMLTGAFPQKKLADGAAGRIIERCICLDPADRFPSAKALKEAVGELRSCKQGETEAEEKKEETEIAEKIKAAEKTEETEGTEKTSVWPGKGTKGYVEPVRKPEIREPGHKPVRPQTAPVAYRRQPAVSVENVPDPIEQKLISILRWVPGFQICKIYTVIPVLLFYFESYIQIKGGLMVAVKSRQNGVIVTGMWVIYFGSFLFACDYLHIRRFFMKRFDKCRWYIYFLFSLLWEAAFIAVTILMIKVILYTLRFLGFL